MAGHIYIIYGDGDRRQAENITNLVEKQGFRCFLKSRDISRSGEWASQIQANIESAAMVIVILGEHTADSMMTMREVSCAHDMHKPILPVDILGSGELMGNLMYYLAYSQIIRLVDESDSKEFLAAVEDIMRQTGGVSSPKPAGKPDKPYDGSEPYIFISYSHKDMDKVFGIIRKLQDEGYRVWYDEGIDPATEWDENIAQHIINSGCLIAFISGNYIASNNCKDEINFARDLDKPRLLIYIEQTKLPAGMAMRLMRIQAIHEYKYEDKTDFYKKLLETPVIRDCRNPEF